MTRPDGRALDEMRKVKVTKDFVSTAEASILIEIGKTRVLCNATIEDKVPHWMREEKKGWVTAEYSLLPRSTSERVRRERKSISGRTQEIQRLVGRSLRGICNLQAMVGLNVLIDCDVIEADGGTRTTSVVGGFMALALALQKISRPAGATPFLKGWLTATSVGVFEGDPILDLCYKEDFAATVDMNVVMNDSFEYVEIQGTGEESTYSRETLNNLLDLAQKGCGELIEIQKGIVGTLP